MNLSSNIHCLSPNICSQTFGFQHAGSHLFEGPVFPFRYTILLGCVGNGVLDLDPIFSTYLQQLRLDIISPLSYLRDFIFLP